MSRRVGSPQRDLARVHNGRAPKEMLCRRSATPLGGEWSRTDNDEALLSWSRVRGLEKRQIEGEP